MVVRVLLFATSVVSLTCPLIAHAQTIWHVDDDNCPGPGSGTEADPFCKIQDGIDAAQDADVIVVSPGVYLENINLLGKAITLRSVDPSDPGTVATTVIDGSGATEADLQGSAVTFDHKEGLESVLDGLTVTGGIGWKHENEQNNRRFGGGVVCFYSSPTIRNCIIKDNHIIAINGIGGGISCYRGDVRIENTSILNNTASSAGGGLYCREGNPTIRNCTVSGNEAGGGGGIYTVLSNPAILNCKISHNIATAFEGAGGGISINNPWSGPQTQVTGCTITHNTAYGIEAASFAPTWGGGGIFVETQTFNLSNNIVWGNATPNSSCPQMRLCDYSVVTASHNNVDGGEPSGCATPDNMLIWSEGNIDEEPFFVDPDDDNYHLSAGSPCIDAGDNTANPTEIVTDLDGKPRFADDPGTPDTGNPDGINPIVDIGAYEFQPVDFCADEDGDGRVTVCHVPPGNSANAHTISVSVNALPAHLRHGDHCGPCESDDGFLPLDGKDKSKPATKRSSEP